MVELELVGVRVELPANQPIVLLREEDGGRYLPIWIGAPEATSIAFALQGVSTPRPLTHDLFVDVLGALDATLEAVHITDLDEGTFYAELHLRTADGQITVSSRPSDALALASRIGGVPLHADEAVLDEAGIQIDEEEADDDEVERFREFLDNVSPEDFDVSG